MKTLFVKVEKGEDGYTIYTENEIFSGIGDTLDDASKNLKEQIKLYIDVMKEDGKNYPSYLEGDYEIKYKFDLPDLLDYIKDIIGYSGLEKLTGIDKKQLWTYSNGTKPHKTQIDKIRSGLNRLGRELVSIDL